MHGNVAGSISINAKTICGICELYGMPPVAAVGREQHTQDWGQVGLARAPEVLDALRDEQIPWLRDGEAQLWPAVCDVLRASGSIGFPHTHAGALPPGDEVRDACCGCASWSRVPEHAKRAYRNASSSSTREEKLGLARVTDLVMEDRPELTVRSRPSRSSATTCPRT
jgi:hypothetical protein